MAKLFKSVRPISPKRNAFNLSFESNLTTEFGRLTPILMQECVPGDSFRINTQMLIRMAPLYAPTMSRVNCYIHYFFFPDRLGNNDFETFITGGESGDGMIENRDGITRKASLIRCQLRDVVELLEPLYNNNTETVMQKIFGVRSLYDYLGFPTWDYNDSNIAEEVAGSDMSIDMRPFIAYASIYNEYYRDENFQKEIDVIKDCQGGDLIVYLLNLMDRAKVRVLVNNLFTTKQRNFEKDYFTSALPWPQRGDETTIGENDTRVYGEGRYDAPVSGSSAQIDRQQLANGLSIGGRIVASVNEFRRALSIQKFREASARFGARYFEYIRGFFGTKVSDARLQRPEFIGGSRLPIMFGEVLQTSETNITPQGSYAGRGLAGGMTKQVRYKCKEFGWIVGILSIMPKPYYMQGLPRKYQRLSNLDFYNPLFANLGEQEIKQSELAFTWAYDSGRSSITPDTAVALNNKLFGYTPRYAEMRYNPNEVHGDFRYSLLDWHTARILQSDARMQESMLTSQFLQVDPASPNRIFNAPQSGFDHFWIDMYHDIRAIRPMPRFATPTI